MSFSFVLFCSIFFERWQKTALLVFSALARVSAKTKCAVCAVDFSACLQLVISFQM